MKQTILAYTIFFSFYLIEVFIARNMGFTTAWFDKLPPLEYTGAIFLAMIIGCSTGVLAFYTASKLIK